MATIDENIRQGWVILKLPSDFLNTHRQAPKSNIYANRFLMLSMSSLRFFHTQPLSDIDLEQCNDLDFEIDLESIRSVNLLPDEGNSSTGFEVESEDRQYEIRCNISYDTNDWIFSIIEARTVHLKKLESEPNLHSKMKRKYSSSRTIRRVLENVVQKFTRNSNHTENSDFLSNEQISCVLRLECLLLSKVDIAWHIASAILDSIGYLPIECRNERAKQLGQSLALWLGEKNVVPGNDSNDIIINDEYYANRLATNKTILQQWIEVSLVKEFKRSCVFSVPSDEKENPSESDSKPHSSKGSLLNRTVKRSYSIEASREFTDSDDDDDCDDDAEVVNIVNVDSVDRSNNYDRDCVAASSPLSHFITRDKSLSDVMTTSATSMSVTIRSMESYDEAHHLIADKNNPMEASSRERMEGSGITIPDPGLITPLRSTSKSDSDRNQIEKQYVQQSSTGSTDSKRSPHNNIPREGGFEDHNHNHTGKSPKLNGVSTTSNPNNSTATTTKNGTSAATGSTSMLFRGDFVETLFITNFMKASALSSGLLSSLLLPTLLAVAAPPDRVTSSPPTPDANNGSITQFNAHGTTTSMNGHHSSSYSSDNTHSNHGNNGVNGSSNNGNNSQVCRDSGPLTSGDEVEVEVEGNLFLRTGRKLMHQSQSHMSPPHRKNFLNFFTSDENVLSTFEPSSFFGQGRLSTPHNQLTTSPPLNTTSGELDTSTSTSMARNRSRPSSPAAEFDVHLQLPPSVNVNVNDLSQTMSSIQTQFSDDRIRSSSDTSARISRSSTSSSSSHSNLNSRTTSPFSSPLLSARSLPVSRCSLQRENDLMHHKTTSSPNMKSKETKLISSVNTPYEMLPKSVDTNNVNATVMSACSLLFQQMNATKQSLPTSIRLLLSSLRKLTIEKHYHTANTSGSGGGSGSSHDVGMLESVSRVERPEYGIYLCCSAALLVLRLLCPAIVCPMECGAWRAAEKTATATGPSERPNLWRSAAIRVLQEAVPAAIPAAHSQEISPQVSSSPSTATSSFLNPLAAVIELTKSASANTASSNSLPCVTAAALDPCSAAMILMAHSLMEGSSMILLGDPKSVVWGGTDEELRAIYSVAEEVANLVPISKATELLSLHSSGCKTLLEPAMETSLSSAATRRILTQVAKILQSCANLSCQAEEDDREGAIRDTASSCQSNGLITATATATATEDESTLTTEIPLKSDSSIHHSDLLLPPPSPSPLDPHTLSLLAPPPPAPPATVTQRSPVTPSAVKYDVKLFQQENSKFLKSYYYEISSMGAASSSNASSATTVLGTNMNTTCKKTH